MDQTERSKFEAELRRKVEGDLLFDEMSRLMFSTDASLYQIKPIGVLLPRNKVDVIQGIRTSAQYRIPILPRGAGTSLAGQTVSPGLVIDCSKYMTNILRVNRNERWVRVQPGVILDNLNDFLSFQNLFFAPDVATSSRATIGGMMGNNSAGVRSIRYGKTVDHVNEVSVILSTGEELSFGELNAGQLDEKCAQTDREGELYRAIRQIVRENREQIQARYPKVMRRVGGYNLDALLDENHFNLSKLIVGSEGTLAFLTEARLNLEPIPSARMVCVIHFDDLIKAIDAVSVILDHGPSAVEILDRFGLELAAKNPVVARLCRDFLKGDPEAVLMVEFSGEAASEIESAVAGMKGDSRLERLCYHIYEGWEVSQQTTVWQVRKNALGVLLSIRGDSKPLPFIEDAAVPVEHLSDYIRQILQICRRHDRSVAMYAHASVGVIHVRPILNLKRREDVQIMRSISEEAFELIQLYKGAWSGEHGDGLVRSYKNREFFGEQLYRAFQQVKSVFDPSGVMNPGKVVDSPDMTANLRIHPEYRTRFPETYYRFEQEQGFDRAIEMCTGVGQCRKTLVGAMCPSYMATRDEEHSTRGRANALRSAIAGHLGEGGFSSRRLYEVLDLCLECKACKSECPSNVDMARLKTEFLAHYYRKQGRPLGKRLMGKTRATAEVASRFPRLFNALVGSLPFRWALEQAAGVDRRRRLPRYAGTTLEKWFGRNYRMPLGGRGTVGLFADTFVNFFEPDVGVAAVRLLGALGYGVELIQAGCCGRPLLSAAMLGEVKEKGLRLVQALRPYAQREIPIVVLEPSCLSTLRDDYPDLIEDRQACDQVVRRTVSLEEFLTGEDVFPRLSEIMGKGPAAILFHGHCQQKALLGSGKSLQTLSRIRDTRVSEIDSACCGMAGAFGYEKEHYGISEQIGARRLFPAVRGAGQDTLVVASGFSCRSQIQHFTGFRAYHLAEALASCMDSSGVAK